MSTLFDMISAIVAFLMSAALLHFGGSAAPRQDNAPTEVSRSRADDSSASRANQRESMAAGDHRPQESGDRDHSGQL
ncbi:hypothetical protein [Asticcacaulis solisilvae]|uniref:hypothetical protein n=1 Tax=Asticcacaulis solisilvae TaxID=1217274 RepID=UPI003FD826BE